MDKSDVKILIVEDDIFMRRLYSEAFKFEGYVPVTAVNGQDGFDQIAKDHPTLILLDIMMPKMNGIELLDKLKADPATKEIPVIMLTNLSGKREAETALMKGAEKYLVKSEYDPKQVVTIVEEVIAKHATA